MLKSPVSRPSLASPKLALVEAQSAFASASASPPSAWRPLSDIVSSIVRKIEPMTLAEGHENTLPKAA